MSSRLIEIFNDAKLVAKIKNRLPYLFQQINFNPYKRWVDLWRED